MSLKRRAAVLITTNLLDEMFRLDEGLHFVMAVESAEDARLGLVRLIIEGPTLPELDEAQEPKIVPLTVKSQASGRLISTRYETPSTDHHPRTA